MVAMVTPATFPHLQPPTINRGTGRTPRRATNTALSLRLRLPLIQREIHSNLCSSYPPKVAWKPYRRMLRQYQTQCRKKSARRSDMSDSSGQRGPPRHTFLPLHRRRRPPASPAPPTEPSSPQAPSSHDVFTAPLLLGRPRHPPTHTEKRRTERGPPRKKQDHFITRPRLRAST